MRGTLTEADRKLMSFAALRNARALIVDTHSSAYQCSNKLERTMRQSVIGGARNLAIQYYGPQGFMYCANREKHADPLRLIVSP